VLAVPRTYATSSRAPVPPSRSCFVQYWGPDHCERGCVLQGPYFATVKDKKGKTSSYHTSGWYNCNNVDQGAVEAAVEDEAKKLQRWERISESYTNALNAEKPSVREKIREKVQRLSEQMTDNPKIFTQGDVEELMKSQQVPPSLLYVYP
jgi:hypothetical protein